MASNKTVLIVAAMLLITLVLEAAPPATAMDCKAGCDEVTGPLHMSMEDCMKRCKEIAAKQGPRDPYKDNKLDIP
jgi:hypothetical protein